MPPLIVLAVIAGLPLLLSVLLRVKPLYLFVGIVTGYFWVQFLGSTAELVVSSMVHISNTTAITNIGLQLLPVLLTLLLMRKTLSASALPFQFVLLVADSLLLTMFILPLLPAGVQGAIYQTHIGSLFNQAHDVTIAAVAALHLTVMFLTKPKLHGKRGKHSK